jgi:hypothetical protein
MTGLSKVRVSLPAWPAFIAGDRFSCSDLKLDLMIFGFSNSTSLSSEQWAWEYRS